MIPSRRLLSTCRFRISIFIVRKQLLALAIFNTLETSISLISLVKSGLITRYQNIMESKENACRHIELYGNDSHPVPKHLYVSCPFSDAAYEGSPYRLEYTAIGKDFLYSRKYVFYVPNHEFIGRFSRLSPFLSVPRLHVFCNYPQIPSRK